jgi:hypothetical protein
MEPRGRLVMTMWEPGGAERLDPLRVEKLGWHTIRGRRAQTL